MTDVPPDNGAADPQPPMPSNPPSSVPDAAEPPVIHRSNFEPAPPDAEPPTFDDDALADAMAAEVATYTSPIRLPFAAPPTGPEVTGLPPIADAPSVPAPSTPAPSLPAPDAAPLGWDGRPIAADVPASAAEPAPEPGAVPIDGASIAPNSAEEEELLRALGGTSTLDNMERLENEFRRISNGEAPSINLPPAPAGPASVEQPVAEPVAVVPAAPEPIAPEPVAPEPVAPERVAPEPVAPDPVDPEPTALSWLAPPAPMPPLLPPSATEAVEPEPESPPAPDLPAPVGPEPSPLLSDLPPMGGSWSLAAPLGGSVPDATSPLPGTDALGWNDPPVVAEPPAASAPVEPEPVLDDTATSERPIVLPAVDDIPATSTAAEPTPEVLAQAPETPEFVAPVSGPEPVEPDLPHPEPVEPEPVEPEPVPPAPLDAEPDEAVQPEPVAPQAFAWMFPSSPDIAEPTAETPPAASALPPVDVSLADPVAAAALAAAVDAGRTPTTEFEDDPTQDGVWDLSADPAPASPPAFAPEPVAFEPVAFAPEPIAPEPAAVALPVPEPVVPNPFAPPSDATAFAPPNPPLQLAPEPAAAPPADSTPAPWPVDPMPAAPDPVTATVPEPAPEPAPAPTVLPPDPEPQAGVAVPFSFEPPVGPEPPDWLDAPPPVYTPPELVEPPAFVDTPPNAALDPVNPITANTMARLPMPLPTATPNLAERAELPPPPGYEDIPILSSDAVAQSPYGGQLLSSITTVPAVAPVPVAETAPEPEVVPAPVPETAVAPVSEPEIPADAPVVSVDTPAAAPVAAAPAPEPITSLPLADPEAAPAVLIATPVADTPTPSSFDHEDDDVIDEIDRVAGTGAIPVSALGTVEPLAPPSEPIATDPEHDGPPAPTVDEPKGPSALVVEAAQLEPTPLDQRAGRASRLFWLWFAANSSVVSMGLGAVLLATGMSLRQAIVATLAGVAISFLPLGLGTLAGKWSGQPTMVVSRAAFGTSGNILPALLAVATRVFWGGVLLWILATAVAQVLVGAGLDAGLGTMTWQLVGLVVGFVIATVVAVFGYGFVAKLQLVISIVSAILIVGSAALTFQHLNVATALTLPDGSWWLVVGGAVLVFSVIGLAWVHSSSDLARYQRPGSSGGASMLWATFGATLPPFLLIVWGALLAASDRTFAQGLQTNPLAAIASLLPAWYPAPLLAAAALGLLSGAVLTIYSGNFALASLGLRVRRTVGTLVTALLVLAVGAALLFVVVDFAGIVKDVVVTLAVPVAAWAGIFAAEMMIRTRRFHGPSLLTPGGIYPAVRWLNFGALIVISAIGFGFITSSAAGLGWEGYLFTAIGVPAGDPLGASQLGVLIALVLGLAVPLAGGISAIRKQEAATIDDDAPVAEQPQPTGRVPAAIEAPSVPVESVPVAPTPVESVPVESIPVAPVSVESVPVEPPPAESTPAESVAPPVVVESSGVPATDASTSGEEQAPPLSPPV